MAKTVWICHSIAEHQDCRSREHASSEVLRALQEDRAVASLIEARGCRQAITAPRLIAAGSLAKGDELPPVRQLAADLGINLNTVARAYRELTDDGLLASVRGRGTIVIATVERAAGPKAEERRRIEAGIAAAFNDAKIAGFSREVVEPIIQRQLDRLWKQAEPS